MAAPQPLPAVPALELEGAAIALARPVVVSGQPGGNVYRLPSDFGNSDMDFPGDPPASLGQFWPVAAKG